MTQWRDNCITIYHLTIFWGLGMTLRCLVFNCKDCSLVAHFRKIFFQSLLHKSAFNYFSPKPPTSDAGFETISKVRHQPNWLKKMRSGQRFQKGWWWPKILPLDSFWVLIHKTCANAKHPRLSNECNAMQTWSSLGGVEAEWICCCAKLSDCTEFCQPVSFDLQLALYVKQNAQVRWPFADCARGNSSRLQILCKTVQTEREFAGE